MLSAECFCFRLELLRYRSAPGTTDGSDRRADYPRGSQWEYRVVRRLAVLYSIALPQPALGRRPLASDGGVQHDIDDKAKMQPCAFEGCTKDQCEGSRKLRTRARRCIEGRSPGENKVKTTRIRAAKTLEKVRTRGHMRSNHITIAHCSTPHAADSQYSVA